jgi:hypothetical protein
MMELTINTNEIFHAGDRGDGAGGVTNLYDVLYPPESEQISSLEEA